MPLYRTLMSVLALLVTPTALFAEAPSSTVGISKEKPADGPSVKVDGGYMVPYTRHDSWLGRSLRDDSGTRRQVQIGKPGG